MMVAGPLLRTRRAAAARGFLRARAARRKRIPGGTVSGVPANLSASCSRSPGGATSHSPPSSATAGSRCRAGRARRRRGSTAPGYSRALPGRRAGRYLNFPARMSPATSPAAGRLTASLSMACSRSATSSSGGLARDLSHPLKTLARSVPSREAMAPNISWSRQRRLPCRSRSRCCRWKPPASPGSAAVPAARP